MREVQDLTPPEQAGLDRVKLAASKARREVKPAAGPIAVQNGPTGQETALKSNGPASIDPDRPPLILGESGHIAEMPDFHDTPDYEVEASDQVQNVKASYASLIDIINYRTALRMPDEAYGKLQKNRALLVFQSHETAKKLEAAGIPGYKKGTGQGEWIVDLVRYYMTKELVM